MFARNILQCLLKFLKKKKTQRNLDNDIIYREQPFFFNIYEVYPLTMS